MKVLVNPEDGAPIKNVQVRGATVLFKDEPFETDTMKKVDDEIADDLLSLYGFLKVLETKEDIEAYLKEKKNRAFKCDKCPEAFSVEIALKGHQRKHQSEDKIVDELGIEVLSVKPKEKVDPDELERLREEAERKHLESGGITMSIEDDTPTRATAM